MEKEKVTMGMDDAALDRLVTAMKRDMFLAGSCMGAGLAGLFCLGAYGMLSGLLALGTVFVAIRGWPWENE